MGLTIEEKDSRWAGDAHSSSEGESREESMAKILYSCEVWVLYLEKSALCNEDRMLPARTGRHSKGTVAKVLEKDDMLEETRMIADNMWHASQK